MTGSSRNGGTAPAAILPLPADAVAQIKSSTTITNLTAVILGLLANSLDAQATKIEIGVDFRRGGCTVEDDGLGIPPSEFHEHGGLAKMHHTSKQGYTSSPEIHGGTGTFLASLAALSLVTITSHHHEHYSQNTMALHRTKPIVRLTPAPVVQHIRGSPHGSRVSVRDLFGGIPVRVKQRAKIADDPAELERNWQASKKSIVSLLLPWKQAVSVKVYDAEERSRSFFISCNLARTSTMASNTVANALDSYATGFEPRNVVRILAQAGHSSLDIRDTWIPAFASTSSISVKGLISLEPAPDKFTQFISIGIAPCNGETGHHELYEAVNHCFSQSSFGTIDESCEPGEAEVKRRKLDRRYKQDGPTDKQRKGCGKGVDRWPRFCLFIELAGGSQLPRRNDDVGIKAMIDILEALTMQWLEENNFRPRKHSHKDQHDLNGGQFESVTSASTIASSSRAGSCGRADMRASTFPRLIAKGTEATKTRPLTPFTEWSRIKSGKASHYEEIWNSKSLVRTPDQTHAISASAATIKVQSLSVGELDSGSGMPTRRGTDFAGTARPLNSSIRAETFTSENHGDGAMDWLDPAANISRRINARTGMVIPNARNLSTHDDSLSRRPAAINTQTSAAGRPLSLKRRQTAPAHTSPSPWLQDLLKDRKTSMFANKIEQAIPVATFDGPGHECGETSDRCRDHDITQLFDQAGTGSKSRLSKHDLPNAEVISQVDQKFILLKVQEIKSDNDQQLLVLVDQHAASERCILEDLFSELCSPHKDPHPVQSKLGLASHIKTTNLETPLQFQVSATEGAMFEADASRLARWGILYNIHGLRQHNDKSESRLEVITLPPGIAERCKAEPRHLIELLRTEIHALAETISRPSQKNEASPTIDTDEPHAWLRQIGSCPKGIIRMLNSRACRSAIMFNDKLSTMECRELIRRLSKCAFPFICAHGRISMVPMVYLGERDESDEARCSVFEQGLARQTERSFASSYKAWRAKCAS